MIYLQPNVYFRRKKQAMAINTIKNILVIILEVFLSFIPLCNSFNNSFKRKKIRMIDSIRVINFSVVKLMFKK